MVVGKNIGLYRVIGCWAEEQEKGKEGQRKKINDGLFSPSTFKELPQPVHGNDHRASDNSDTTKLQIVLLSRDKTRQCVSDRH